MNKTKIIVCGSCGRMGVRIVNMSKKDDALEVSGAVEMEGHPLLGSGEPKVCADLSSVIASGDVVIDFTSPEATLKHLDVAREAKKAMVIGTTGLKPDEIEKITLASREIPIVFAPNMSIGVNLLFKLISDAAKAVPGYDMEIVELHHNQKKDAPSGTAVKLFQILGKTLERNTDEVGVYGRQGVIGARKKEEIGVMSVRAGDIVGEHTVYFAGPGERLELTHRAHSRDTFASGSLAAAKWLVKQKTRPIRYARCPGNIET